MPSQIVFHKGDALTFCRMCDHNGGPSLFRGKIIEDGMASLQTALKLKPDNFDALTYMNLLYREKAKIETDDAKKAEDVAQADKYREQALELRKKSLATTPTAEPAK